MKHNREDVSGACSLLIAVLVVVLSFASYFGFVTLLVK